MFEVVTCRTKHLSDVEGVEERYENVQAMEKKDATPATHRTGKAAEAIPGEPQPALVPCKHHYHTTLSHTLAQ